MQTSFYLLLEKFSYFPSATKVAIWFRYRSTIRGSFLTTAAVTHQSNSPSSSFHCANPTPPASPWPARTQFKETLDMATKTQLKCDGYLQISEQQNAES